MEGDTSDTTSSASTIKGTETETEDDLDKLDEEAEKMKKQLDAARKKKRADEVKQRIREYKSELKALESVKAPRDTHDRSGKDGGGANRDEDDSDKDEQSGSDDDEISLKHPVKRKIHKPSSHHKKMAEVSDNLIDDKSVKNSQKIQLYHQILDRKSIAVKPIRLIKMNGDYRIDNQITQDDCKLVDNCYHVTQVDSDEGPHRARSWHSRERRPEAKPRDERPREERPRETREHRHRGARPRDVRPRDAHAEGRRDDSAAARPFLLYSSSQGSSTSSRTGESRKRGKHHNTLQSGIMARATDMVRYPQDWPHIALQGDRVSGAYTFHELTVTLFVTGELELISKLNISPGEQEGRLRLLRQLMYLSRVYEWHDILKLYAEVVSMIELGLLSWISSFEETINWAITRQGFQGLPRGNKKTYSTNTQKKQYKSARPTYCKEFQHNACAFQDNKHWGTVNGERMQVEHICAACLMKRKEINHHSEVSTDCPCKANTGNNTQ